MTGPEHASAAPEGISLADSKARLARSRLLGRVSAFIFLLAALAVLDALQTLVRHEFNSLDLVPGETVLLSGMMPEKAKEFSDLEVLIEGAPDILFTPVETYKGFWMGGFMWRAELTVQSGAKPGKAVLTIVDIVKPPSGGGSKDERDRSILYGGMQNPALVFSISIWPSEAERRAADTSLFRRFTGFPAFGVAAVAVLLAIAFGIANWRVFSKAESGLARHGIFFIHGVKDVQAAREQNGPQAAPGYKAAFARAGQPFTRGDLVILYDKDWQEQGRGRIVEVDKIKAHALFPHDGVRPKYGWLAGRGASSEREQ